MKASRYLRPRACVGEYHRANGGGNMQRCRASLWPPFAVWRDVFYPVGRPRGCWGEAGPRWCLEPYAGARTGTTEPRPFQTR